MTTIYSHSRKVGAGLALAMALILSLTLMAQAAPTFTDDGFAHTWQQADKPVDDLGAGAGRGYTWGPAVPEARDVFVETYDGVPRTVQYFDKARMEANRAVSNPNDPYFVTTGLLVKELVTGSRQDGNNAFTVLTPSQVQIAGDSNLDGRTNQGAPTYASFRGVGTFATTENGQPNAGGQQIVNFIDKAGQVTALSTPPQTRFNRDYDSVTHHNIADVFVDFMNQSGPVWDGQRYVTSQVINGLYVMGRPLTEPYWVRAVVAGTERDVLVQLFERRVLTYTPANPPAYRVEMGNVGQHYWAWRYVEHGDANQPDLIPPASNQPNAAFNYPGSVPIGGPNSTQVYKLPLPSLPFINQDGKIALTATKDGLVALNLGGDGRVANERWRLPNVAMFSQPLIYKDTAYFSTFYPETITAVDLLQGKVKWTYSLPEATRDYEQPITDGNNLYFAAYRLSRDTSGAFYSEGRLYALRLFDGKLAWQTDQNGAAGGVQFAFDGKITVGTLAGNHYLYTRQGQVVPGWLAVNKSSSRNFVYSGGLLYTLDTDQNLLEAFDVNGKVFKSVKAPAGANRLLSVVGERVYLQAASTVNGYATSRLIGLSQADLQTVKFSYELGNDHLVDSVVVVDQILYFVTEPNDPAAKGQRQLMQVSSNDPTSKNVLLNTITPVGGTGETPIVNRGHVYYSNLNDAFYVIS